MTDPSFFSPPAALFQLFSDQITRRAHQFLTESFTSPNMIIAFPYAIRAALVAISVLMLCCTSQPIDSASKNDYARLGKRKVRIEDGDDESTKKPQIKVNMAHALPF
ncbi:hypothetical protein O181_011616 [Austropuccinia psidii MF-1]|uniref:Uncharacterized protein n=1 Tax=Austropuccinia psidii MF-1 TaxID=1389203 RepID=A0A9Q3BT42_9BASI|nr:hypothetical protein [Austropuccinia psidii MF-1]